MKGFIFVGIPNTAPSGTEKSLFFANTKEFLVVLRISSFFMPTFSASWTALVFLAKKD